MQFVGEIFDEVDADGSGNIDKMEFRDMLRALNLYYRCTLTHTHSQSLPPFSQSLTHSLTYLLLSQ